MISIKPAKKEDHDFIRKTHHLAYREMVERQFGKWNEAQQDGFVDRDLSEDNYEIVFYNREPCGYFSLNTYQGKIHLIDIAILPKYQSKGIGGSVIEKLKGRSKQMGRPLSVGAFKTNSKAQRFYEKHRFKICGETDIHFIYKWKEK